jgi:hypothetical protein
MKIKTREARSPRPARKTAKRAKRDYEFIARAERAFRKVARQVRAQAKLFGLKPLAWNS